MGAPCSWCEYASKEGTLPAKDYLEHILEGGSDALRPSEDKLEDKDERENEFDGHDEFADTAADDFGRGDRVWRRRLGLNAGLGRSRGGGFPNGGIHSHGAGIPGGPEALV